MDEFGSTETIDMSFNLDLNLQRMQEETRDEIIIMDFKEVTATPYFCRNNFYGTVLHLELGTIH